MSNGGGGTNTVESYVPPRLDRLPFSRWHVLVIVALGITCILVGLKVTIVGIVASVLTAPVSGLNLSTAQIGYAATIYIAGACLGGLFFSYLADRYGRKKMFLITLVVYLVATVATAFSFSFWFFVLCRFFTGAGIGGEYSVIYSAMSDLVPAWLWTQVALFISGRYWLGTMGGIRSRHRTARCGHHQPVLGLEDRLRPRGIIGIGVLLIRLYIPESRAGWRHTGETMRCGAFRSRGTMLVSEGIWRGTCSRGQR